MTNLDGGTPEDRAMRERLDKLSHDLGARNASEPQRKPDPAPEGPGNIGSAMSMGFRVMSEFVAAVVVSALIGWQVDRWLGTTPILLLLFCGLGTAAGFWTVYRIATRPTGLPGRR